MSRSISSGHWLGQPREEVGGGYSIHPGLRNNTRTTTTTTTTKKEADARVFHNDSVISTVSKTLLYDSSVDSHTINNKQDRLRWRWHRYAVLAFCCLFSQQRTWIQRNVFRIKDTYPLYRRWEIFSFSWQKRRVRESERVRCMLTPWLGKAGRRAIDLD